MKIHRSVLRLGELCQATLDLGLGQSADIPLWLRDIAGIQRVVYTHSIPYALILYEHYLLLEGRYEELHRCEDLIMQQARAMHYILPRLYHTLYLAIAEAREGSMPGAASHMKEALQLALPDRIYLPFARLASDLKPLSALIPQELAELRAVCSRREQGVARLKAKQARASLLTPREREVFILARDRLSAKEISTRLCISIHTVNTILKNIYRKLKVGSKADLKSIRAF